MALSVKNAEAERLARESPLMVVDSSAVPAILFDGLRAHRRRARPLKPVPAAAPYSGRAKTNRLLPLLGRSSGVRSRKRP